MSQQNDSEQMDFFGTPEEEPQSKMWATPRVSDVAAGRTLNEKGQRTSKSSSHVFGANLSDQVVSTSSQAGSRAKTSRLLETKKVSKPKGPGYGQSSAELLGRFDPITRSLKTSQLSFLETTGDGFSEFCGTFPRSGMMRSGTVFQLPNLALTITEIGSGSLPTPTVMDATLMTKGKGKAKGRHSVQLSHLANSGALTHKDPFAEQDRLRSLGLLSNAERLEMWPTPRVFSAMAARITEKTCRWNRGPGANLEEEVARRMFPTPTVQDSNKATKKWREDHQNNLTAAAFNPRPFPTPTSRDYKGGYNTKSLTRQDGKSRAMDLLPNAVLDGKGTETASGSLNPQFCEWLMGYPLNYTCLED
tara:strand:- start:474 stop:1556 length:1083 start_codon:yes stop_codon:yes gene_type:complete